MSPDSTEASERALRDRLDAAGENARQTVTTTRDAELREPAERFLANYAQIGALSGREFCHAAFEALNHFQTESAVALDAFEDKHSQHIRELFENVCQTLTDLMEAQDELNTRDSERRDTAERYPKGASLRAKATILLTDADRIRALNGEDFTREAKAALAPITKHELEAAKLEIYARWATRPARRLRRKLTGRISR